ncbi:MAG: DUF1003 domain-containing protein [Candidatus Acidiferrales bacterium]|jgi:uncharacterized membrane protein
MKQSPTDQAANPTQFNIEAISSLEHEALNRRTTTGRASDSIVRLVGSVRFLVLQVVLVTAWTMVNLHLVPGLRIFDPFPFGILALVVSSESVCLTIFVLISQNRMVRQTEKRSHLDLQVSMLAEQELTTALQMLQKLCKHVGVDVKAATQEVQGFSKTTDVHKLATELEEKLPGS